MKELKFTISIPSDGFQQPYKWEVWEKDATLHALGIPNIVLDALYDHHLNSAVAQSWDEMLDTALFTYTGYTHWEQLPTARSIQFEQLKSEIEERFNNRKFHIRK